MKWIFNSSLKIKLVVLITTLTASMLLIFAYISVRDFESDKVAYVFDTNQSHARSAASQIASEISFVSEKVEDFAERVLSGSVKKIRPSKSLGLNGIEYLL